MVWNVPGSLGMAWLSFQAQPMKTPSNADLLSWQPTPKAVPLSFNTIILWTNTHFARTHLQVGRCLEKRFRQWSTTQALLRKWDVNMISRPFQTHLSSSFPKDRHSRQTLHHSRKWESLPLETSQIVAASFLPSQADFQNVLPTHLRFWPYVAHLHFFSLPKLGKNLFPAENEKTS